MRTKRPYQLPEPITADRSILENISVPLIEGYISKHESKLQRYKYLGNLYKGFHDIWNLPEKEDWKPDNRLAVGFPRYITETFLGYGYGIPIKVSTDDDTLADAVSYFYRNNEMVDHDAEMAKLACMYGHAFEYFYQDEDAETKVVAYPPTNLFCVYDDTVKRRALLMVQFGRHEVDGIDTGVIYGQAATAEELITFDRGKVVERKPNPYWMIPCVEWRLNEERIGLYEGVAGLIETYNKAIGEKANDVDAFAEAYLSVIGAELDDEDVYRIRDSRIINLYGTDNAKDVLVQFLTKPTADGTQENLLNRLERLIYQVSMVANISDETFGSATSGVALSYKLQAMSNLAATFDRKIEKSLRKRFKIWSSLRTNTSDPDAWQDLNFQFTRNLPRNVQEEAQTAAQLSGIVSKETQLSVLSIVQDAKAELKRLEDEQADSMDLYGGMKIEGDDTAVHRVDTAEGTSGNVEE